MDRTGAHTFATPDTFGMVRGFRYIHIHPASPNAAATRDAFVGVYPHLQQGYPVQEGVKGAQGTKPLTEWSVKHHAQRRHCQQDQKLPAEQTAQGRTDALAGQRKGDRPFQYALGTHVLTEERVAHTQFIGNQRGQ